MSCWKCRTSCRVVIAMNWMILVRFAAESGKLITFVVWKEKLTFKRLRFCSNSMNEERGAVFLL
jgi:hypothetical protein